MEIGPRIRKLRVRQGRTLAEIAKVCGFTRSLLSKIENGRTTPPIATLLKIADALGVKPAALLSESAASGPVYLSAAQASRSRRVTTEKGYTFLPFASGRGDKLMEPTLIELRKGKVSAGSLKHGGEEFLYVLEGEMRYRVGKVTYALGPGDTLYFDAEEAHDFEAVSKTVRYLCVFVQPAPGRN